MDHFTISILCILLTSAIVQFLRRRHQEKLPPGPFPLPIVGNLFLLGKTPHKSLANLAKIHGPLMTLKLGHITTLVVSSTTIAKQVYTTHDLSFSNRPVMQAVEANHHRQVSVGWSPVGSHWINLRRICTAHLFSCQKLEANQHIRRNIIRDLVLEIEEFCVAGKVVDIGQIAFTKMLDALSSTFFSVDLSHSGSDFAKQFKRLAREITDEIGTPNLADYFPFLRKFDPQGIKRRMTNHQGKILDLFDGIMDQRLKMRKEESYVSFNDTLDSLLTIMDENNDVIDRNCINHLFLDLFLAGTEVPSSAMEWAMTELLRNPKTLSIVKRELELKIGKGKILEESDINKLPYLQAIIKETLRLHTPAPLLVPHEAREDVEMCGFRISKGTQVLINVWAIARDPSIWKNPESFMPERFLGKEIDVRGMNFELIPFGGGRRICPGLPLAMRLLPLFLGSMLNCFDWKLEDGVTCDNIDMEEKFSIALMKAKPLLAIPLSEKQTYFRLTVCCIDMFYFLKFVRNIVIT